MPIDPASPNRIVDAEIQRSKEELLLMAKLFFRLGRRCEANRLVEIYNSLERRQSDDANDATLVLDAEEIEQILRRA